ncbi:MAG: hypothetical protein RI883_1215 [Bacteroidota bacterium]|jgi:PAS domain S-box-containing protein
MNNLKNIYIVEDEIILAMDIKHNLISLGYNVAGTSSNGEDCLEKIKDLKIDLILMDINLSKTLTGLETARIIDQNENIPIVFLTAFSDDNTLKQIKETGYYGYITKPFKSIDLKTEIEFTLDRYEKLQTLKTENKQSQQNLRKTEEFFQQVVNNVSDFIYQINLKGYFIYVNPTALQQTGFKKKELLKMKYSSLLKPEYKQQAYHYFKNLHDQKEPNGYIELPIITHNGEEIWVGQKIQSIFQDKDIIGFQVVARDITNERNAKEQLIIAKKNAENSALLKAQFLANMSHEIRTPLNGIIGVINLLSKTELTEKQQTYIEAITSSSDLLMGLINDVLDLSKIDAGKMEIVENEFDLQKLVQTIVTTFEIKANEKNIKLNYHIDEDVPIKLIGDSFRLNQIYYNLIGNALKFTPQGEISICVKTVSQNAHSVILNFTVTDTGIGMTEETIKKVFQTFVQADGNTTRTYGGTGLGLPIIKKLIELQNGKIDVTSEINVGSCFSFQLKFKISRSITEECMKLENIHFDLLENKKILLVEDNIINQLVTRDLLQDKKAIVTVANNGLEALSVLESNNDFSIILMDLQMPVMDGFQAIKEIRKQTNKKYHDIPILALSANVIDTEIEKCIQCGANNYLAKPFKPDILYQRLTNLITNKQLLIH